MTKTIANRQSTIINLLCMLRTELEQFLEDTFQYENFEDHCRNGLQVEGKESIHKLVFGVSFNLPLLKEAITFHADAIIAHHGFFGKDFFSLKGMMKDKIKLLFQHEISLFGIHLPLDAHREYGNNSQLFSYIGGEIIEPYEVGFIGKNSKQYSLSQLLDIFHQKLHPEHYRDTPPENTGSSVLMPKHQHGFLYFDNGPDIPERIAIISGGASRDFREGKILDKGIDTFICGSVDEPTPAISYETGTNFINLGHYWSEKPGLLALQAAIEQRFDVETVFIEIENVI